MLPEPSRDSQIAAHIVELHVARGAAWVRREIAAYISYYWEDAHIFAVDTSVSVPELRRSFASIVSEGGGPLSIDLPRDIDLMISQSGDAVTTSYQWRSSYRMSDGVDYDRLSYETNVWYRREGVWKIARMHLTRLSMRPLS
jgi:ketosteroid isomerase-like protein